MIAGLVGLGFLSAAQSVDAHGRSRHDSWRDDRGEFHLDVGFTVEQTASGPVGTLEVCFHNTSSSVPTGTLTWWYIVDDGNVVVKLVHGGGPMVAFPGSEDCREVRVSLATGKRYTAKAAVQEEGPRLQFLAGLLEPRQGLYLTASAAVRVEAPRPPRPTREPVPTRPPEPTRPPRPTPCGRGC